MNKFFRKIRQQLLTAPPERSRAVTYLLYAIGEIILVVIGILIALQINNWNGNKNNIAQAQKHLETIKLNLKDDIIQAEKLFSESHTTYQYSDTLLAQFKTIKLLDNNMQMYLLYLMFERNIEVNASGFGTLINSNGIPFIKEELQVKLLDY